MTPARGLPRVRSYVRALTPHLPSSVWILESGALLNSLGSGFVLPFSVIYFHNIRHFPLGEAAAIVAVISAVGIATGPLAGTAADRFSSRSTLRGSLALMAIGYVGFPFVRAPWEAFALAVVAGAGNGSFYPSQASLLGGLTPPEKRHVGFSLQRVMTNLGYGLGGLIGGFIASTTRPWTFDALFFIDAGTFLAYIGVLGLVPNPTRVEESADMPGSYRDVLRDRSFLVLLAINALLVTAGYSLFETLAPAYAKNDAAVPDTVIGGFFLANTIFIVIAQLPLTRLIEGRRRMRALALQGVLWAFGLIIVLASGSLLSGLAAGGIIIVAFVVFSIGECLQSAILSPTAADLAPPRLLSRYMALVSFTWQLGLAVGPAVGGFVLETSPEAVWLIGAGVCVSAGVCALALEPRLAVQLRRTPRTLTAGPQRSHA